MATSTAIRIARFDPPAANAPVTRRRSLTKRVLLGAVIGVVAIGAAVYGKVGPSTVPAPTTEATTGRTVTVTTPTKTDIAAELILPVQTLPNQQATLFPRVDGYVMKWYADRGAQVVAGQLLAEIDAPELDQQVRQAAATLDRGRAVIGQLKADRDQAAAEADSAKAHIQLAEADGVLANQELERSTSATRSGVASRGEQDTFTRNRDAAIARLGVSKADAFAKVKLMASRDAAIITQEASVRGLEADLSRLKEVQKFKRVVAPFAGTVTRRQAEVGMLVTATGGSPLFHIQDSSVLRVQVDVPQRYAVAVRRVTTGQVLVPELPNRPLAATVARTADSLDPITRTLRVEIDLPNADRAVLSGTFAKVRLSIPSEQSVVMVPVGTLRHTASGVQVAVVTGNVIELRSVTLGRDYGRSVEVTTGLSGLEQLVVNPADDLRSDERVRVVGERPADNQTRVIAATWPGTGK